MYTWVISSPDHDGGAIQTVFEKVSNPEVDGKWLEKVDVESLSRYCGALWYLKVVPDRLPSYGKWKGHASIHSPDNPDDEPPPPTPTKKLDTALATARVALVLGQEQRFRDEIKLVLSMMPGSQREDKSKFTSIKRLRVESLKGVFSPYCPSQCQSCSLHNEFRRLTKNEH